MPALDQPENAGVLRRNGLILGNRAAIDENGHFVGTQTDLCEEIRVGLVGYLELVGPIPNDLQGDAHTRYWVSRGFRVSYPTTLTVRRVRSTPPRRETNDSLGAGSRGSCLAGFKIHWAVQDPMSEAVADVGREEIWIEKYRPRTLDDVVGQDEITDRLARYVERNDLSHLLFSGPAGTGKTSAAHAIAHGLYGEDWAEHFLELNASDERGIDVVRDRIKHFARSAFGGVDYRIIFLDEADSLTNDAQSALRRTMEQFSHNTRFILSCNYSSRIIDPIQSRCAVFRFSPVADEAMAARIRDIADAEGIDLTESGIEAVVYTADGDMRKAINALQAAAVMDETIDDDAVYSITATARPEVIEEMVTEALSGDFTAARSTLDDLLTQGLAGGNVIDQLHRSVWNFDLSDEAAVQLLDRIGEADYRIAEGANERIQLEALLAAIALAAEDDD